MTALKLPHSRVLAELADGLPQHVSHLARIAGVKPHQLNGFWQQMPAHIRGLLRQHDGQWRLVRPLALFNEEALQRLGAERGFQTTLKHECTSSNDEILNLARTSPEQAHKSLCVAHLQTKGRGRQGRKWTHRLGECLMFSFGWVFDKPQHELGSLAPAVALACRRALAASGLDIQIKWPNDLVAGRDKLGGILIETVRNEGKTAAVIGIGINFVLPKEVENAASVQALFHNAQLVRGTASVHCIPASTLLDKLLGELNAVLTQYAQNGFAPFLEEYQTAHRDHGKPVLLLRDGQTVSEGTVLSVDAQGALHLMTAAGEQTVVSGEISLRPDDTPKAATSRAPERLLLLDGGNSQLKWAWVENGVFNEVTRAPYRDLSKLGEEWAARSDERTRIVGCAVCGDLKKALVEAAGDFDKALKAMREKGLTKAEKRGDRETREGIIASYVHDNRLGAIVEVNCETSFVANTDEFKELAHKLAMQIASMNPLYVSEADIPEAARQEKAAEFEANFKGPENMKEQIINGQIKKAFSDKVLMLQPYILDDTKTVAEFIKEMIAKTGENITVRQFKRIELGVNE